MQTTERSVIELLEINPPEPQSEPQPQPGAPFMPWLHLGMSGKTTTIAYALHEPKRHRRAPITA